MSRYTLTADLFQLPETGLKGNYLYAPFQCMVMKANDALINLLSHIEHIEEGELNEEDRFSIGYLIQKGVINGRKVTASSESSVEAHKLALFITNRCNLGCRYCYAGRFREDGETMALKTAVNAISYFGKLSMARGLKNFTVEFHGGGEPFYEFDLLKSVVSYLESYCLQHALDPQTVISTNGVLSVVKRRWAVKHITSMCVSFEGLPEIQNIHRPFPNGSPSFKKVDETLRYFDSIGYKYSIRITVSHLNIRMMKETIDFIADHYKTNELVFEPVNNCGSASFANDLHCNLDDFAREYEQAEKYAVYRNLTVRYSGSDIERFSAYFCYVGTNQFAVTPDGYLTNCWEVTSKKHPYAGIFIVGKIGEDGSMELYQDKLEHLKVYSVHHLEQCTDCFAKWHCSGDCALRAFPDTVNGFRGNRCTSTRYLMARKLIQNFENQMTDQ